MCRSPYAYNSRKIGKKRKTFSLLIHLVTGRKPVHFSGKENDRNAIVHHLCSSFLYVKSAVMFPENVSFSKSLLAFNKNMHVLV